MMITVCLHSFSTQHLTSVSGHLQTTGFSHHLTIHCLCILVLLSSSMMPMVSNLFERPTTQVPQPPSSTSQKRKKRFSLLSMLKKVKIFHREKKMKMTKGYV